MADLRKGRIDRSQFVRVVSDVGLAGAVADGKLVPVLIVDRTNRPDIEEFIRQHQHLGPGDVLHQWAVSREDDDCVILLLKFERPSEVEIVIAFSIEHQGIVVDSMLRAGAVYLQAGSVGDPVSLAIGEPKVLVELSDTGFSPHWDLILLKRMTKVMAVRMQVSRRKAGPMAKETIAEMRRFASIRAGEPE